MVTLNLTEEEAEVLETTMGLSEGDGRAGEYLFHNQDIVMSIRRKLWRAGVEP